MGDTSIEWCDKSWNPVTGCTKVSPGCKHFYAERVFPRTAAGQRVRIGVTSSGITGEPENLFRPRRFTDVRCHPDRLEQPLHWRRPARIFVNSMSDLFHEAVPFEFIDKVWAVMALTPQHIYQILTKRPERMRKYLTTPLRGHTEIVIQIGILRQKFKWSADWTWPLSNVWLGVSVENQQYADERIPILLQTPAALRFVSYEPALGAVDFKPGVWLRPSPYRRIPGGYAGDRPEMMAGLNWVIVGGESGPDARSFDLKWARDAIRQCKESGVACFMKQCGWNPYEDTGMDDIRYLRLKDSKGENMSEWAEDLRVREFPGMKPTCFECGRNMEPSGQIFKCSNCGASSAES